MSADWKAGDKAVCVDDSPALLKSGLPKPASCYPLGHITRGVTYLVSAVHPQGALFIAGKPALHNTERYEKPWRANRFRKLIPACDRVTIHEEATQ